MAFDLPAVESVCIDQQLWLCQQKEMIHQHTQTHAHTQTQFCSLVSNEYDGLHLRCVMSGLLIGRYWRANMKY